ncbi:SpoIIE family protein phosphatase [Allosalinactinospora lopnorensis]|uniref:SpoIIE family protein phosphatase n=1 Tax=Allosalinactinospora lopnorensis TaxID=1352348 RepID=UPI00069707A9|nr:SpoIIE family protein phosphatase [Allosalinactinospora lopnorensis]
MDSPTDGNRLAAGGAADRAALRVPLSFLNEAIVRLGASLDPEQIVRELGDVLVPVLADVAAVHLTEALFAPHRLDGGLPDAQDASAGRLRRSVVAHGGDPGRWYEALPGGDVWGMPPANPVRRAVAAREPVLVERVDSALARSFTASGGADALAALLGDHSLLAVPLCARGRVLGALLLLRSPDRAPFDDVDVLTAAQIAAQAGLVVHHADLYRAKAGIANTLQRSMLPRLPPRVAGFDIASRYLSSSQTAQVGGDWFDAIPLPGGRVALVVGDVMGHGIRSATAMGQFRTAVQTLAALDLPPDHVLRSLDELAEQLDENYLATCLYVVYDPVSRCCSIANAGHIPPVLLHTDGRAELLTLPTGAPIGVGGIAFESVDIPVDDGAVLTMCTDGLVERRGEGIGDGLSAMCSGFGAPDQPLDDLCDRLIDSLLTDDREDDAALLMARLHGIDPGHVAHWFLEPRTSTPSRVRRLVRTTLADWDLSAIAETTELLVTELVTNAVRHSSQPIELRLLRTEALLCEVADSDHQRPVLRHTAETDESGRGLQLVSRLARRWGSSAKTNGKVVWFEQELPPPGE